MVLTQEVIEEASDSPFTSRDKACMASSVELKGQNPAATWPSWRGPLYCSLTVWNDSRRRRLALAVPQEPAELGQTAGKGGGGSQGDPDYG